MGTMSKNLSLEEFIVTLKEDVRRFKGWWEDEVVRGTVCDDPGTMPAADWFEQFLMFCEDGGVEDH